MRNCKNIAFAELMYFCVMDDSFEKDWQQVVARFTEQFGGDIDHEAILFLIGVQELGHGKRKFTKDQKLDVMHIAICRLLSPYGFYELEGLDEEGWPHWKATEKLPMLKPGQQNRLIREAIIEYAKESELI